MDSVLHQPNGMGQADTQTPHPNLLLFYDWPPSSAWGGLVLLSRLLASYPSDKLIILTGSYTFNTDTKDGRVNAEYVIFPTMKPRGLFGFGWAIRWIDYLLIPLLILLGIWVVKQNRVEVILTVAHGHFFIAAALVGLATSVPYILIVHDDWVSRMQSKSSVFKSLFPSIFRLVAQRATHIYVVNPGMQEMLKAEYGVESELQMPATERFDGIDTIPRSTEEVDPGCIQILYAGWYVASTLDSLDMLIKLVKGQKLLHHGAKSWVLDLYIPADRERLRRLGWEHERIKVHGWVSQNEIRKALKTADILFLPYSFKEDLKFLTTRSFPSKAADYLASGKPILIFAPPFSSIVQYARRFNFAEVVDQLSEDALARGICNIWRSKEYREKLRANALSAFEENHNIARQRREFLELVGCLAKQSFPGCK